MQTISCSCGIKGQDEGLEVKGIADDVWFIQWKGAESDGVMEGGLGAVAPKLSTPKYDALSPSV